MSGEHVRDLSSEIHDLEHSTAELMKQRDSSNSLLGCVDKKSEVLESLRARQTDARSNSCSESLPVRRSKGPTPLLPKTVHSLSEDGHLSGNNLHRKSHGLEPIIMEEMMEKARLIRSLEYTQVEYAAMAFKMDSMWGLHPQEREAERGSYDDATASSSQEHRRDLLCNISPHDLPQTDLPPKTDEDLHPKVHELEQSIMQQMEEKGRLIRSLEHTQMECAVLASKMEAMRGPQAQQRDGDGGSCEDAVGPAIPLLQNACDALKSAVTSFSSHLFNQFIRKLPNTREVVKDLLMVSLSSEILATCKVEHRQKMGRDMLFLLCTFILQDICCDILFSGFEMYLMQQCSPQFRKPEKVKKALFTRNTKHVGA